MARFARRGIAKFRFATTIANVASPTRAEITGSVAITPDLNEIAGLNLTNSPIPTPDMDSVYVTKIPGEDTTDDPTLTFYEDDTTTSIRTTLAKGVTGFLLVFPLGDVPTKKMEIWKVQSTGMNRMFSAGNEPAKQVVRFAVLTVPSQDVTIPA